jgi:hypothetical protein
MTATQVPSLRVAGRQVPLVLPSIRDARLHTAAVIISVHTIGITALGFRVSVFQILSAILTAALVDVTINLRLTGKIVWPASGMLTGSGVALILRLTDMHAGDFWAWDGWYLYAAIAGLSVLSKYVLRWRGTHLFNPSNLGLVVAFLLLGSSIIEPLDFWWAPLHGWMALAYLVILGGGIAITRRLALFEMALAFWVVLAAGLGVLAASGHCMVAAWAPEPLCGSNFWWVLVTSPEVLIFMLFMITDPKTIPRGRLPRLAFSVTLGLLATLLIAPQTTEFGAKVALLGSLVLLTPVRSAFERLGNLSVPAPARPRAFLQGAWIGAGLIAAATAVVLAGAPARSTPPAAAATAPAVVDVDPASLPEATVDAEVASLNLDNDLDAIVVAFAENLATEAEALRRADGGMLAGVATGDHLAQLQRRLDEALTTGVRRAHEYRFDSLHVAVAERPEGQSSAGLSVQVTGTRDVVVFDALGNETSRSPEGYAADFMLRQVAGDRWLIAAVEES